MATSYNSISSEAGKWGSLLTASASLACAVHCAATPFLLAILPAVGVSHLVHETAEAWVIGFVVLMAIVSGWWNFRHHRSLHVPLAFAAAIGLLLLGHWLGHAHPFGSPVTAAAGFTIAGLQWRHGRRPKTHAHHGSDCCK